VSALPNGVQLGLGLTQLGRRWGFRPADVPNEDEARALLAFAVQAGVRVFDTAPAYGSSEVRLGTFLRSLSQGERHRLVVMTKCGEQWDDASGQGIVDHRYESLARSIDQRLERLGEIDVLQLHRGNAVTLRSADVRDAFEYARRAGIRAIGASVSDIESARAALDDVGVSVLQFPYSRDNEYMEPAFALASAAHCSAVVNRPLGMGRLAYPNETAQSADPEFVTGAFRAVLAHQFDGAVLSGTSSVAHLAMNIDCFVRGRAR
jgi:aryl-alcohol dehydrogenase-like predicted oxidoreductase